VIDDDLTGRAAVAVGLRVVGVLALVEILLPVAGAAVAHHAIQSALDDAFTDSGGEVTHVKADRTNL
jgi:hypothetical protein